MIYEKNTIGKKFRTVTICILIVIIFFLPLYLLLNVSLRDFLDLSSRLFLTKNPILTNYKKVLTDPQFWVSLKNTVFYAVIEICILIPIASIGGYSLARSKGKVVNAIRTMNILIMMIPGTALLVGTYSLMVKLHLTNSIFGIALLGAGVGMTGAMFFYTVFASSIPIELDEASSIDGAGVLRTYFQIILPQLKAITITRIIGIVIGAWNSYLMPMYLLTKSEKYTILLYVRKMYAGSTVVPDVPLAFAGTVLMITPVLVIYFVLQKHIIGGQIDSGIKG